MSPFPQISKNLTPINFPPQKSSIINISKPTTPQPMNDSDLSEPPHPSLPKHCITDLSLLPEHFIGTLNSYREQLPTKSKKILDTLEHLSPQDLQIPFSGLNKMCFLNSYEYKLKMTRYLKEMLITNNIIPELDFNSESNNRFISKLGRYIMNELMIDSNPESKDFWLTSDVHAELRRLIPSDLYTFY
jgi:hypothetical protein